MGRIKMDKSNLAERMKTYYENIPKTKLMRKVPVTIRLDRDMPILKGENRQYVDKYIYVGEE